MSEIIKRNLWFWRLVIFKFMNGYFSIVATAMCAANVFEPRTTSIILAFVAGSKWAEGFINQDIAETKKKLATIDTQFLGKSDA